MPKFDVIGVCGYGNSGASAVMDLISDCEALQVYRNAESQVLHSVDGILDLKHYIVECRDKVASNTALKRYKKSLYDYRSLMIEKGLRRRYREISEKYIDDLIICAWKGFSAFDAGDVGGVEQCVIMRKALNAVSKALNRLHIDFTFPRSRERCFSILEETQFDDLTSAYFDEYFRMYGFSIDKPVVMEQFFVFSNPRAGREFFKSGKTILVERDPRDVYASSKFNAKDGASVKICRFMPTANVREFVKYYKALHTGIKTDQNTLVIHFEDLIYEYGDIKKQIAEFLGVDDDFGKNFHPEISVNNTKFYKKCAGIETDIDYICRELPEFLNSYVD